MLKTWAKTMIALFFASMGLVIASGSALAAPPSGATVAGPPRYFVVDLGTLGGTQGNAEGISDHGWVVGSANLRGNKSGHAYVWRHGTKTDLGTLGGLNSQEQWPVKDDRGLVVGSAETAVQDPFAEDFCGFDANSSVPPTGLICDAFAWSAGSMTALPNLGGNNGQAWGVNNFGQVVGMAETGTVDSACAPPQVLDIAAVLWPAVGMTQTLPPLSGDSMAWASGINDSGQVVGVSGTCMSPNFNLTGTNPQHGVIWQNGLPSDLGNLGGNVSTFPWAINSHGQVVGFSYLSDESTRRTFLWENGHMRDLGAVRRPGIPDITSQAFGMNNRGDVVGASGCENVCRGYIWHGGKMTDLNTLVAGETAPLYVLWANDINDRGEIALYTFNITDHANHAAVAIPCDELPKVPGCAMDAVSVREADADPAKLRARLATIIPESIRRLLRNRARIPGFGFTTPHVPIP